MRKIIFASLLGLVMFSGSAAVNAGPPGFYAGGNYRTAFPNGQTTAGYNYYSSPYGYQTFNSYNYAATPWGWSGYQSQGTFIRPYVNAPVHSVYWDPFANTYRYGTGRLNTPSFYSYQSFGW